VHIFRKHQKPILITVFALVGFSMLFFGVPAFWQGGGGAADDPVVAQMGDQDIRRNVLLARLDSVASRQSQSGEKPSYREMFMDGTVEQVLQAMADDALISLEESQRQFDVDNDFAIDMLKQYADFQDKDGNFDANIWNNWLDSRAAVDWNAVYADVKARVSRNVHLNMVLGASTRILDSDIEERLADSATKIQVKYAQLVPKVTPTDEEIQKQFDDNQDTYKKPSDMKAEFVAISLRPEPTDQIKEVLQKLKAGGDFATLSNENSNATGVQKGGDIGWQQPRPTDAAHRKALFALNPGEISDAVYGPGGFYIYKAEEKRLVEGSEDQEVKARQMFFNVSLTTEERAAKEAIAQTMIDKVLNDKTTLAAIAKDGDLQQTNLFNTDSIDIENVSDRDARQFRTVLAKNNTDSPPTLIKATENYYVAKVMEWTEGEVPELDTIRDKVETDTIAALKLEQAYKDQVQEVADKIKTDATSLDQVKTLFPDLEFEVKTSSEFTVRDYLFQEQLYLSTAEIYQTVGRKDIGTMGGPLLDFRGETYFVELLKRTDPTEEDKATWEEDRKLLRDQALQNANNEFLVDYRLNLRQNSGLEPRVNQKLLTQYLNLDVPDPDLDSDVEAPAPAGESS
jgi:parvulin-like peptidyl-prolyl isomerase